MSQMPISDMCLTVVIMGTAFVAEVTVFAALGLF